MIEHRRFQVQARRQDAEAVPAARARLLLNRVCQIAVELAQGKRLMAAVSLKEELTLEAEREYVL